MSDDTKKPEYPDPEWFTDQMYELRSRMDALARLARTHGIELKTIVPTRRNRITLKEAVYLAIARAGHPMHVADLLEILRETGVSPGGRKPANTLHATLSQDGRVKRVGTNTWALVAWGDQEPNPIEGGAREPESGSLVEPKPKRTRKAK